MSILGKTVNKFDTLQPEKLHENTRKIVSFRNRSIHKKDAAAHSMIWEIIKTTFLTLQEEVLLLDTLKSSFATASFNK